VHPPHSYLHQMSLTLDKTQAKIAAQRKATLDAINALLDPINRGQLEDETTLPAYGAIESGSDGYLVTLHANGQEAIDYFLSDDSDYTPQQVVCLDTGEGRRVEMSVEYTITDTIAQF
jgi:hypothetical protein